MYMYMYVYVDTSTHGGWDGLHAYHIRVYVHTCTCAYICMYCVYNSTVCFIHVHVYPITVLRRCKCFTALCLKPQDLRIYIHVHVCVHSMLQVIRLALERLQIFEDKTLYELYEGRSGEDEAVWKLLNEGEYPVIRQENWSAKDTRYFLKRKRNASLVLQQLVSQYILPGNGTNSEVTDLCLLDELSKETMLSTLNAWFSAISIYT